MEKPMIPESKPTFLIPCFFIYCGYLKRVKSDTNYLEKVNDTGIKTDFFTIDEKGVFLVIRARSIYQETLLRCLPAWLLPLWSAHGFWAFGCFEFNPK
ncbi:unnamed protein product [Cunninghamella blakesleeana]